MLHFKKNYLKNKWSDEANMVSNRKKRQSNRKFPIKLDDFDQNIFIGNAMSDRQENITVNEGTPD